MSGGAAVLDRGVVLIQCRTAAEKRLGEPLGRLLDALAKQLEELGQHSREREERDQYLGAVHRLQHERDSFAAAFRKAFAERFEECARGLQGTGLLSADMDAGELRMLKTNVLENEAAIGRLSIRLKESASAELGQLSGRFATLFKCSAVNDGDNPLGPLTIARSVFAGFGALRIEGRALRAVRPALEEKLAEPVRELYQALNAALAGLGVAPTISRTAAAQASFAAAGPTGAAPPAATPASAGVDADAGPSWDAEVEAASAVASVLAGSTVPAPVESFLKETWLRLLARAYDAQGAEGAAWREAVGTMQELAASLKPGLDAAERARLVGVLPTVLKRLTTGMDAVALPQESRKTVLDALMVRHRELLRPSGK